MIRKLFAYRIIVTVLAVVLMTVAQPLAAKIGAQAAQEVGGCRITASGVSVRTVQRKVGVTADGILGPVTCNAIKAYQCTKNLNVDGVVGPITWGVMSGNTPPRGVRICADLKNQKLWLSRNGSRVYNAERMRSGDPRLSQSGVTKVGNHQIYYKDIDHVSGASCCRGASMPYSMFFYGGQAIHASSFSTAGSHGCINVTYNDARYLWDNSPVGTPVSVWGARPL